MGLPVDYLGTPPANLGDMVTDPAQQARNQAIYNYFKRNRKASRSTYGAGLQLPSISGLRLRRKVKTKYGLRDVITDSNGLVYGYANPAAQLAIGKVGSGVGLTRAGKKPGAAGSPANPASPASPANPGAVGDGTSALPGGDEFTGYGDYPWIATYLRGLQKQEGKWNNDFKQNILPGVTAGLNNLANIGANVANLYGGSVGTNNTPGYVTNAYNAASAVAPAQVQGGLGGATSTYNPTALAAAMGTSASAGQSAAANGTYNALTAAATPVTAAQGLLSGLTAKGMAISQSYATKRMTERLRLDQWIQDNEIALQNAQTKQDYTNALLKLNGIRLDETKRHNQVIEGISQQNADTSQANAETARINANNAGQKTDAQIASSGQGFIKVPAGAGPKNRAIIEKTEIVSKDGTHWYRPKGAGNNNGGSTTDPTAKAISTARKTITASYVGGTYDPVNDTITPGSSGGINKLDDPREQGRRIASLIRSMLSSKEIPANWLTKENVIEFVNSVTAANRTYGNDLTAMTTPQYHSLINEVLRKLL